MAEIIEFGKKAQDLKGLRDQGLRQRKIEALKKVFQCSRCLLKCAKCGSQLEMSAAERSQFATPYPLCRNCQDEYREYRERTAGKRTNPDCYWYNEKWMRVWESWLEHQSCLDEYRQSKEFLQLLEEVEELLKKQP
ncbi:MAG: hypothetical protein GX422_10300 [Deltaproteobacteria bacterium]|jgi:NAD-dependent SIR2 family protein deacetylase|nr:hypothetical protein [Deltaproteobacteria bacterium]